MEKQAQKPGVGFGIMILKGGKVLLGKRHEDPEKASSLLHGEGTWTMPGGKLHFQEGLKEAVRREVLEETEIEIKNPEVISVSNDTVYDNLFLSPLYLFLIIVWTIPWKGVALWKAARNSHKKWFIAIFLLNTMALL